MLKVLVAKVDGGPAPYRAGNWWWPAVGNIWLRNAAHDQTRHAAEQCSIGLDCALTTVPIFCRRPAFHGRERMVARMDSHAVRPTLEP